MPFRTFFQISVHLFALLFLTGCDSTISSWIGNARAIQTNPSNTSPEGLTPDPSESIADLIGTKIFSNQSHSGTGVSAAKFSDDGTMILTWVREPSISGNYRLMILDGDGLNPRILDMPIKGDSTALTSGVFTPNGNRIVFTTAGAMYSIRPDGTGFAKLTPTFANPVGVVSSFKVTPNSGRVVYMATAEIASVQEVYACDLDGNNHVKLSGGALATGGAAEFTISANGSRVVYRSRNTSASPYEVFSVLTTGAGHLKLNDTLPGGGFVRSYLISPDGNLVLYTADVAILNQIELFITPIGSAVSTKLNGAFVAAGDILTTAFNADGTKVIYGADALADEVYDIFSVNVDGTGLTLLNVAAATNRDAQFVRFDPTDSKVYYAQDDSANNVFSLYSVDLDGTNRTLVVANFGTYHVAYNLMPGGYDLRVQWTSVPGVFLLVGGDNNIYRVNKDGSGATLLSPTVAGELPYAISPTADGTALLYSSSSNPGGVFKKVYYVGVNGAGHTLAFGASGSEAWISSLSNAAPTGKFLLATATRMLVINSTGTSQTEVLGISPVYTGVNKGAMKISNNNQKIVARQELPGNNGHGLFAANADGTGRVQLSPGLGEIVSTYYLAPDNLTVHALNGGAEVYRVNLDGTGWSKVSGATPIDSFRELRYSAVGDYMVYEARQEVMFTDELYACKNDGTGRVKLNGVLFSNGDVRTWHISPTAAKLVYVAQQTAANVSDLYTVNLDGTGNMKINPALPVGGMVTQYTAADPVEVSADGTKIVYAADQVTDNVTETFSVNWDGTAHTKLNSALIAGGDVQGFRISPDSQSVVFQADLDTDEVIELYRVAMNGTGQIKLSGTLVSGGDVVPSEYGKKNLEFTSDSQYVVFYADKDTDGVIELYSAKLDGSAIYKLNQPLVSGGTIKSFTLTEDGTKVVYLADANVAGRNELFSVSLNGTGHKKINRTLSSGDRVESYIVKRNNIAFRLLRGNAFELYRSNSSGSSIQRLHSDLIGLQAVGDSLDFSPDGSLLFFNINNEDYRKESTYFVPMP